MEASMSRYARMSSHYIPKGLRRKCIKYRKTNCEYTSKNYITTFPNSNPECKFFKLILL